MGSLIYSISSKRVSWETETGVAVLIHSEAFEGGVDQRQAEFQAILGILRVEKKQRKVHDEFLVYVTKSSLAGMYEGTEMYKIEKIRFLSLSDFDKVDEIVSQVKNFIQSHDFYYFAGCLFVEDEFIWNKHMKTNLLRYFGSKTQPWILFHQPPGAPVSINMSTLFCGFFTAKAFKTSADFYHMKLLSLVSSNRVGTRYLCRGMDSEGNVSLFVKTHFQTKRNNRTVFDFSILRGSIPIFWSQNLQGVPTKVSIYGRPEAVRGVFAKHFRKLEREYGRIHVINLLGERRHEKLLTSHFTRLLELEDIPHTNFDMNAHTSDYDNLKFLLYFKLRDIDPSVTFRVNCLDCLDRTNVAQFLICRFYFEKVVDDEDVSRKMRECWTDNGNSLSNLYTGSDAMKSELALKGKRSLLGYMDDFVISATRLINGRFTDRQKHNIINVLLEKKDDPSGVGHDEDFC